ncbi:MAG: aldo/keto reductase [Prevotellaceae bacterium]|nr:aldo/keto reductase [Prevotellaceae bacterium]
MKHRTLGMSGLRVSAVGLGCMGMSHGYGDAADKDEMKELLSLAVDMGYSFFDTAEVYGTADNPHDNEYLLGEALAPYRDKIVIATKFGLKFDNPSSDGPHPLIADSSPSAIRKAVEGSLKRLKTDHIDLYYQHRIDPEVEPETVADTMASLIKEGKILHWGISETTEEYLRRAHSVCRVTAVQNRYSMMARWHEALFPVLEELGVGLVAFSPLANGFLSGCYSSGDFFDPHNDYRAYMPQFTLDGYEKNHDLLNFIGDLSEEKHATFSQIALAWMLCKKPWIVPIPGTRKLFRLKENICAVDIELTKEEVDMIDKTLDTVGMSDVFGGSKVMKGEAAIK